MPTGLHTVMTYADLPEEMLMIFTSISSQIPDKEHTVGVQVQVQTQGPHQYKGNAIFAVSTFLFPHGRQVYGTCQSHPNLPHGMV